MSTHRKPGYIANIDDLQTGDVLLFQAPRKTQSWGVWMGSGFIKFFQALVFQKHGHYDTTHAGICVRDTESGRKYLAHVVDDGFGLVSLNYKYHWQTPFFVYRPKEVAIAEKVAECAARPAASIEEMKKIKWSSFAAFKAYFLRSSKTSGKSRDISKSTICSKFVIQTLKKAAGEAEGVDEPQQYFPNLNSSSTPKALEANLHNNSNYELLCFPGAGDPYQRLKAVIVDEIDKIAKKKNGQAKYWEAAQAFNKIIVKLEPYDPTNNSALVLNSFEKALKLAEVMLPILQKKRGFGLRAATSYRNVSLAMRDMGIFKRDWVKDSEKSKEVGVREIPKKTSKVGRH